MTSKKILAGIVAVFALVVLSALVVSAVGSDEHVRIDDLEVNGVDVLNGGKIVEFTGDTVPVRVQFFSNQLPNSLEVQDVRVKAWLSGASSNSAVTGRFDVLPDRTYTKTLSVPLPDSRDIDHDEREEDFVLTVLIESKSDGRLSEIEVDLSVQRESYMLSLLDVDMSNEVAAGDALLIDVVLKNAGRRFAEDTFVVARIPALGVEDRGYFGDLSAVDQSHPDKEDANERRLALRVPRTAPAGVYVVEIEAFNQDSITSLTRKVVINGASADTIVVSPVHSKTFAVGETEDYSITIVNAGSKVQVYEFVVDSSSGLSINTDEPIAAVPAGTSRTVKVSATGLKEGKQNFAVNIHSGTELVKAESFTANVEGTSRRVSGGFGSSGTVLLTVVLAIIFVVLLVVLIVLLTRQPEKSEEFGESYY